MKTIEEAAKEYEKIHYYVDEKEAFKSGADFAQRWISVEEEMPENSDVVLIKEETLVNAITGYFSTYYKSWISYPFNKDVKVTHWRPIEIK